ncbi:GntP family permease [Shewanella gaetbuli]|uniref:GntP family permease n=1 Tax=Shewanella gaetbuli TaxID=220752 RepID=A0A9X1ZRE3_9GAMM|nr:GntP family permease [Shewanella gaetbuli]MCL1142708.1 GntP family permease [Shewanella gaetbuli]
MEYVGLVGSVILLMWLALKGVDIIFASLLCSLIVVVTNGLPLASGVGEYYAFGSLGAFSFAGKFFLLFISGAMFGRMMSESHAAASIGVALSRKLGPQRALLITVLCCSILTYSGVVVFVVIFAMYPLGLILFSQANIPKRLFCASLALGVGTYTLTALPGTPSIQNVIASSALGTDLFAGAAIGIWASVVMFGLGMWYLERQRKIALQNNEGFELGPKDSIPDLSKQQFPHWALAIIPMVVVLFTILLPRILMKLLSAETLEQSIVFNELLTFATSQPILWPSLSLLLGSIVVALLFKKVRANCFLVMGRGTQDSIMPLLSTAAVVGFGGVVTHTVGFQNFVGLMSSVELPPILSMFSSISVVSAITGSSAGGLQIFLQTMSETYLNAGIPAEVLHRISVMASGGFDSLPHCGAIIALLTITQMTHKQAYKDIGVLTVVFPVIATVSSMVLATILY